MAGLPGPTATAARKDAACARYAQNAAPAAPRRAGLDSPQPPVKRRRLVPNRRRNRRRLGGSVPGVDGGDWSHAAFALVVKLPAARYCAGADPGPACTPGRPSDAGG